LFVMISKNIISPVNTKSYVKGLRKIGHVNFSAEITGRGCCPLLWMPLVTP
jgi:hypothetical protein